MYKHIKLIEDQYKSKRKGKQVKVYYSKDGKILRAGTGVYLKTTPKDPNELASSDFKGISEKDKSKVLQEANKFEEAIESFLDEYEVKPTRDELKYQITLRIERKKSTLKTINECLTAFIDDRRVNGKPLKDNYSSLHWGLSNFIKKSNYDFKMKEISEDFYKKLFTYLLFESPACNYHFKTKPTHIKKIKGDSKFDNRFGLNNSTLIKRMETFREFLKYCEMELEVPIDHQKLNAIEKNVKRQMSIHSYNSDTEHFVINHEQYKKLKSKNFEDYIKDDEIEKGVNGNYKKSTVTRDRLIRVKDIFLVQTATALRHSDLIELNREKLDRKVFLSKKTDTPSIIVDNNIIRKIIDKHNDNLSMTNQKYNQLLKVLFKQFFQYLLSHKYVTDEDCYIYKTIRKGEYSQLKKIRKWDAAVSHSARRSFATMAYFDLEFNLKQIMPFTGHSNEKQVREYIQLDTNDSLKNKKELADKFDL